MFIGTADIRHMRIFCVKYKKSNFGVYIMKKKISTDPTGSLVVEETSLNIPKQVDTLNNQMGTLLELGFVYPKDERGAWAHLITEAWNNSKLPDHEDVKEYLIILLERYVKDVDILDTFVSLEYYTHLLSPEEINPKYIQRLGDICLLYSSLYSGKLSYRHYPTSLKAIIELGEGIFYTLHNSRNIKKWEKRAYKELYTSFVRYTMILSWVNKCLPFQMYKVKELSKRTYAYPRKDSLLAASQQGKMFKQMFIDLDNEQS